MFSPLLTPRLRLRRLEIADAEAVHAYRSDPRVARFQSWGTTSAGEVAAFLERMATRDALTPGEWFQIAITLRDSGQLVGDCGLRARADDRRQVEAGITLSPAYQRRGMAREALTAVLSWLFTEAETHRVFCSVDPRNEPCLVLLTKIGLRREAHLIESLWIKGMWADDVVLALLRREWKPEIAPVPKG